MRRKPLTSKVIEGISIALAQCDAGPLDGYRPGSKEEKHAFAALEAADIWIASVRVQARTRIKTYQGVRYITKPFVIAPGWAQCGTCGRAWDDATSTALTPTPSGRCPFEHWHRTRKDAS